MPIFYAQNIVKAIPVLNISLPLDARVKVLEIAVTQLQQQVKSLQTMVNVLQQAQTNGFNSGGLASFEILSSPGMSNVVIPFFGY
jgi:hypothetical protein